MPEDARPLLVAHCLRSWLPQTQTWLYNQIRTLPPEITSHVYARKTNPPGGSLQPPDSVTILSANRWPILRRIRIGKRRFFRPALRRIWAKRAPDVVHSHFGDFAWRMGDLVREVGAAHVVTFYGHDVTRQPQDPTWKARYQEMWAKIDRILCEGPHMRETIIALGAWPDQVHVHHLGIELDRLPYKPRTWTPKAPLKVLMAASFRQKKGFPDGILALGHMVAETGVDVELTLIGDCDGTEHSKEETARIDAALASAGLADTVRRLGYVDHDRMIQEAYDHHLFLSPSRVADDGDTEGGAPVGILEMAATGMPVISTTHCDIPDVIDSAGHHLLAPERDIEGIANRLGMLTRDHESWASFLAPIRKRIEKEYDVGRQAEALASHYRAVAP